MENKTTTELLNLLTKLVDKDGRLKEGYEEAWEELRTREPFYRLLNGEHDESIPCIMEYIYDIREDIKKLKRHKHEPKSGDVLIRI